MAALVVAASAAAQCLPAITIGPGSLPVGEAGETYPTTQLTASGGTPPYTWKLTTALPDGLSFDAGKAIVSGTPTTRGVGTTPATFTIDDSGRGCGSKTYSLAICPAMAVTPTVDDGTYGVALKPVTFSVTGLSRPAWSWSGRLPAGVSLTGDTLAGTPTELGRFNFTVTATEGPCSESRNYTITIDCPNIAIGPATIPNGTAGTAYPTTTFTASNVSAAGAWTLVTGSIPRGMSLRDNVLSGTPTETGSFSFTVGVRDANGCSQQRAFSMTIGCPSITITPALLSNATVGQPFSATFAATGGVGVHTLGMTGAPDGLSFDGAKLTGTPTTLGQAALAVTATDGIGCRASKNYTLNVVCPTITVLPTGAPSGRVGTPYSLTLSASGGSGSYDFVHSGGDPLPPGLSIVRNVLQGTPTTVGTSRFTIKATDSNGCSGTEAYAITIDPPQCPAISISPASLPAATKDSSYSALFSASGGTAPYGYSLTSGALPAGITLSGDKISGTPAVTGSFTFVMEATDANRCTGVRAYTLAVNPAACPTLTISPASLDNATAGVGYRTSFTGGGGTAPYSFTLTAGALPPGLTLSGETLGGTPTTPGSYNFTIGVADGNRCLGSRSYTLVVESQRCPSIAISPEAIPAATVGTGYRVSFSASAGTGPYSYAASGLPAGFSFSGDTLNGLPAVQGTHTITITASDANRCVGSRTYTLQINPQVCPADKPALTDPPNRATGLRLPLTLSWTAVERAISYKVFAKPAGGTTAQLGATTATSLTVSSLTGGDYEWWVEAQFSGGCPPVESAHNAFSIAVSLTCPAEAPVLESPANGATEKNPVTLQWSGNPQALRYNVYGSLNGKPAAVIASPATDSVSLTFPEGVIDWFVEAVYDGCTKRSQTFRFTVAASLTCPTAAPAVTAPANGATVVSPVTAQWSAVSGATLYRIHAALEDGPMGVIGSTSATQLSLTMPKGTITLQVEAVFADCPSTFSGRVVFTVGSGANCPTAPTSLVAPPNDARELVSPVTFTWTAMPNAVFSRLYASYNGSPFEVLAETRDISLSRILPPGSYSWFAETHYLGCDPVRSATFRFTVEDPKRCPTGPIAITSPAAGASVTSPLTVTANAVAGAAGYRLWVGMDGAAPAIVAKGSTPAFTASLPSGTAEAFVEALVNECPSILSPSIKFTVQRGTSCEGNQPPALVSPLGTETSTKVELRWNGSAGAIGYRVWLAGNGEPPADLGITKETTISRELKPGIYLWFVEAIFDNCPPLPSSRGSFTVVEQTPRCGSEAPAIIAPADGATVTSPVTFLYSSVLNAIGYRLYGAKANGAISLIGETAETSFTKPVPDGTYLWFVEAVFKNCSSTVSPRARFTVPSSQNCQSERPQLLTPRDGAETTSPAALSWTPVSGAVKYVVVARREDGSPAPVGETEATAMNVALPPGLIEWYVVAIRPGCSPIESARGTFLVTVPDRCAGKAPVLIAPDANVNVIGKVTLSWTAVAGARAYRVHAGIGGNVPTPLTTTGETSIALDIPEGRITWHVEALFEDCPPQESAPGQFTVVPEQGGCHTPEAPGITVVGQVLSGTEFTVRWTGVGNAASYELQESSDGVTFTTMVVNDTSRRFMYTTAGGPIVRFYRVRAVSACSDERGPYSPLVKNITTPTNTIQTQTRGTAEIGVRVKPIQTLFVPGQPAPVNFTARTDKPWMHVTPASGILPPEGLTFTLEADPEALLVGANTATLIIEYAGAGKGASASPPPTTSVPISTSLVTPVGPGGKNTPPPDALIIPAVAHAQGANNSLFQSDVRLANTSTRAMNYQLFFTPSGNDGTLNGSSTTIQVEAGATVALDDVLASFFGSGTSASASGVLEIRPLSSTTGSTSLNTTGSSLATATVASSRTYNVTTTGTFGQYIPAIPFGSFIAKAADGTRAVLSLQQIAQSAAYRTNLGLVEGAGERAEVLVTVFDGSNAVVGQIPITLQPAEHKQLNGFLAANNIALEDGRIEVEVTSNSGKVTAYASTIDNLSNDPLLVSPILKSSAAGTRYVIPGVAYTDGLARWRTDVRLYNTSSSAVSTTLTFHPQGGSNPLVANVTLQPGETRALDNVLSSLFGVSSANAGGSVLVTTEAQSSLIASARTYAQTDAGTYGQFIPAVTPQDGVGLGERSLHLIQLEQSSEYRTNIGLVETSGREATAEVSLILPDSKLTPKVPVTLPANGFVQFPLSAFGIGTAAYNARISVRVMSGQGRVSAYGSVIDNRTQDPTYVPAQ
jgi:hypothetical protein